MELRERQASLGGMAIRGCSARIAMSVRKRDTHGHRRSGRPRGETLFVVQEQGPDSLLAALAHFDEASLESALTALDRDSGLVVSVRDAEGRLLYLNDGTRRVFRLGDVPVAGRVTVGGSRYFLPGGREIPLIDHPAQIAARSGLPQSNVVFAIERPDQARRWLRMSFLPFHRSDRGWSVLGIGCDVTDLYEQGPGGLNERR